LAASSESMSKILERIEREAGVPGLVSILAERLKPTDLQSVLLEVHRLLARRRRPSDVLSDYETNRFVRPSKVSPTRLLEWERVAFSALVPEFEAIALSPVCPLGTNSAVASVDQNWAVSTDRNTEIVSDPTNVLALECALRRRQSLREDPKSTETVHLAASHRVLRPQRYESPDLLSHFGLFGLCSAGRDQRDWQFDMSTIALHARFYIRALRAFLGPDTRIRLSVTDFGAVGRRAVLEAQTPSPIQSEFPNVDCEVDDERTSGRAYYQNLCFHVHAADSSGRWVELADGGSVDWAQKLLSNSKERLVISGIGSERVCTEFESPMP
jgi:hypothetical protein